MSSLRKEVKDMTYRVYVTDSLKAIGHLNGQRYIEAVNDYFKPQEKRNAEEIIANVCDNIEKL